MNQPPNFQHSQPQSYQNYQVNNFNQQDTMAYNSNTYNLPESYRQSTNQNSEPFNCYQSNEQKYQEDAREFPFDYTYGEGRK